MRTRFRPSILAGYNLVTAYRHGYYLYPAMLTTNQTTVLANGLAHYCWMPVHTPVKVDRLGINVTQVDATGGVRLGIYRNTAAGMPGELVVDGGVASIAALNGAEVALPNTDLDTGNYWLCMVAQGTGGAGQATAIATSAIPCLGALTPTASNYLGWTSTSVPGALPMIASSPQRATIVVSVHPRLV